MPNLLGQNIDNAIQMIKDAGLTYNGKSSDYSDSYSENQVMNQSISAGKTVDEGTTTQSDSQSRKSGDFLFCKYSDREPVWT